MFHNYLSSVTVETRAKVNLALNITGVKGNLHLIDTVIVPIGLADTVKVSPSDEFSVCYHDGRSYLNDTAYKTAELLSKTYKTSAVSVNIVKRIPEGKGLGGSSADAAGVARAMQKLFNLPQISSELLLEVGSDVPAMYLDRPLRVRGRGELVKAVVLPRFYGILLLPLYSVNTREVYALYDKIGGEKADIDGFLTGKSPATNALERAALVLEPKMNYLKEILTASGTEEVIMTGSGSGWIGLARNPEKYKNAKEYLESLHIQDFGIAIHGFDTHNMERLWQKTN